MIAPIAYLRLPPGLERHCDAAAISAVARQLEALLVGAVFPEMTAPIIPPLLRLATDPGDAQVLTRVDDLTDRYARLASRIATLTAADLGLPG